MPHRLRFPFPLPGSGRTRTSIATVVALGICSASFACIRRPVSNQEPTTKMSFDTYVAQPAIEKIDLLLMVDSSASMADKQRILADAVPDLIGGVVSPACLDKSTRTPTGKRADPTKPKAEMCPAGSEPAFPPITDMHIGVLSSSLGSLGGTSCPDGTEGRTYDDHGRLLARGPHGDVAAAGDLHFLAWYPDVEKNRDKKRHPDPPVPKTTSIDALGSSLRDLIVGVGQKGCGLEAQLESVYRFLVMPDPWASIDTTSGRASYGPAGSVDAELLRQRAAFLRPDSLVAVVMLTDEDDSISDPLSFGGSGWRFMESAPRERATTACASAPASSDCTSCAFDPQAAGCSPLEYTKEEDPLDVRFHHMKQRYGVDPQFPISRYVDGLTKLRVPGRDDEHTPAGVYAPQPRCTNPLFAAQLPTEPSQELCDLPRGSRAPDLVYFALIGGVHHSLVPGDLDADGRQRIDWVRILGRDPSRWDEQGIDPHMVQSSMPRPGLPGTSAADDADAIHGREWTTNGYDLQYACTFDLYERPSDPSLPPVKTRRTCESLNPADCDCNGEKDAPLCDATDRKIQVRGKAYPTRRELLLARELDNQGIVASLCPKQLTTPDADDYGYRPAVKTITDRLERQLVGSCLPRGLDRQDEEGNVACLVLTTLPDPGPDSECARFGLAPPREDLLRTFRDKLRQEDGEAAAQHPICEIPQMTVPPGALCKDASEDIAFCYVEAPLLTHCPFALSFTEASQKLDRARFSLQCIQQTSDAGH